MDFFQVSIKEGRGGILEVYPDFLVKRSRDLMVQGRSFYAVWDEEAGLWSRDEYDVQRLVDAALYSEAERLKEQGRTCTVKYMASYNSKSWPNFRAYLNNLSDNSHQLDSELTFSNTEIKKTDYVSRRLPYALKEGPIDAWDEMVGTLYSPEEREKIEWAIGAIVSGDAKKIQKFLVLYGPAGTGKSTVLNIVNSLFQGYVTSFEAKALGSNNGSFATEAFKGNPLVAIQHDGDLSKIEDNTRLNSIIAHEEMTMNEKYKPSYTARVNAFLFMGTNQPVKISDAKSGIIRRLIDVNPTGKRLLPNHYQTLMTQIDFELGAIAYHCWQVYLKLGKNHYNTYRPVEMMLQTDVFFNYIEAYFDIFKAQDGVTLTQAYSLYKEFCEETGIGRQLPKYKVREELRNYFRDFDDRATVDGVKLRSYYSGFTAEPFRLPTKTEDVYSLALEETTSIFDNVFADQPAQYAKEDGTPSKRWSEVTTTLADIDTSQLHYVLVPEKHIVIDFDIRGTDGRKELERNLESASGWPATYAEISQGGEGVHLHYEYDGDPHLLSNVYSEGVEVKVYTGHASLRRRLSKCNSVPMATINSGLPLKEKKPVLPENTIKNERGLRNLIVRNLKKGIHPGTKPSIDFIEHILKEAYDSGIPYDVSDMRGDIMAFANNSTNQALLCLKTVQRMKFRSEEVQELAAGPTRDEPVVFFDVEVYPNLFVVCWKYEGKDQVVRMINPTATDIEGLFQYKLVGFNNRRYDNHILYAAFLGYDNSLLYKLSQRLVANNTAALFGEAYNLSYADIYDFSSKKQSLKKFEIELGIPHMEINLPWDEAVKPEDVDRVVEYCANDVNATEAVFEARRQDFVARQILADLSGLTVNDTTQKHTARILFGKDKNPQKSFVYTDLSKEFDGYVFDRGVSAYRGENPGEGGYVYAEPGIYTDVALLDVASMHPTSIVNLDLFGPYTGKFKELLEARLAIKHRDYDKARKMLDGRLGQYLGDDASSEQLAYALKIVINIVYGLTSAKFDNAFRDVRNVDNIVAKRGALFMIDLKHAVQEQGFTVAHIKTDSIKIPNATPEIIQFVIDFGKKYGYDFEHEGTYEKFCLVNDAVYIARKDDKWTATGAQFAHPYVFKKLFSHEDITMDDLCETKQVSKGAIYLDFDFVQKPMFDYKGRHFVGRTGRFMPVTKESGGGVLLRVTDEKDFAVAGTKGYFWIEDHIAKNKTKEDSLEIDMAYFENLADEAQRTIEKFGNYDKFVS